jgi:hypothetical protein
LLRMIVMALRLLLVGGHTGRSDNPRRRPKARGRRVWPDRRPAVPVPSFSDERVQGRREMWQQDGFRSGTCREVGPAKDRAGGIAAAQRNKPPQARPQPNRGLEELPSRGDHAGTSFPRAFCGSAALRGSGVGSWSSAATSQLVVGPHCDYTSLHTKVLVLFTAILDADSLPAGGFPVHAASSAAQNADAPHSQCEIPCAL